MGSDEPHAQVLHGESEEGPSQVSQVLRRLRPLYPRGHRNDPRTGREGEWRGRGWLRCDTHGWPVVVDNIMMAFIGGRLKEDSIQLMQEPGQRFNLISINTFKIKLVCNS